MKKNMKTKFFRTAFGMMAVGAVLLSGCTKDIKDDVDKLKGDVEGLQTSVKTLQEAQTKLDEKINAGALITSAKRVTSPKPGVEFTFSNGDKIVAEDGAKGNTGDAGAAGKTPMLKVNAANEWVVSYDGGVTYTNVKDANNNNVLAQLPANPAPQMKIDPVTKHWMVSTDGKTWTDTNVKAEGKDGVTPPAPKVQINPTTKMWEISVDGGATYVSTGVKATGENGVGVIVKTVEGEYVFQAVDKDGVETGEPIKTGIKADKSNIIHSITEDAKAIVITLGDGTKSYTFKKQVIYPSSIVILDDVISVSEGQKAQVRFRVNPANADLLAATDFELDLIDGVATRSFAVTPVEGMSLADFVADPINKGEYTVNINCTTNAYEFESVRVALVASFLDPRNGADETNKLQVSSNVVYVDAKTTDFTVNTLRPIDDLAMVVNQTKTIVPEFTGGWAADTEPLTATNVTAKTVDANYKDYFTFGYTNGLTIVKKTIPATQVYPFEVEIEMTVSQGTGATKVESKQKFMLKVYSDTFTVTLNPNADNVLPAAAKIMVGSVDNNIFGAIMASDIKTIFDATMLKAAAWTEAITTNTTVVSYKATAAGTYAVDATKGVTASKTNKLPANAWNTATGVLPYQVNVANPATVAGFYQVVSTITVNNATVSDKDIFIKVVSEFEIAEPKTFVMNAPTVVTPVTAKWVGGVFTKITNATSDEILITNMAELGTIADATFTINGYPVLGSLISAMTFEIQTATSPATWAKASSSNKPVAANASDAAKTYKYRVETITYAGKVYRVTGAAAGANEVKATITGGAFDAKFGLNNIVRATKPADYVINFTTAGQDAGSSETIEIKNEVGAVFANTNPYDSWNLAKTITTGNTVYSLYCKAVGTEITIVKDPSETTTDFETVKLALGVDNTGLKLAVNKGRNIVNDFKAIARVTVADLWGATKSVDIPVTVKNGRY